MALIVCDLWLDDRVKCLLSEITCRHSKHEHKHGNKRGQAVLQWMAKLVFAFDLMHNKGGASPYIHDNTWCWNHGNNWIFLTDMV